MQVIALQVLSNFFLIAYKHTFLFKSQSKGVQNKIKLTLCAPLSEKMAPEWKKVLALKSASLHNAWAGPEMGTGDARQIFRHLTANGWALDDMNSTRCLETQEELFDCTVAVRCN